MCLSKKFNENWTETKEYKIRKIIYKESRIELVKRIREVLKAESHGLAGRLSEINIFYMLVVWMVYTNRAGADETR